MRGFSSNRKPGPVSETDTRTITLASREEGWVSNLPCSEAARGAPVRSGPPRDECARYAQSC